MSRPKVLGYYASTSTGGYTDLFTAGEGGAVFTITIYNKNSSLLATYLTIKLNNRRMWSLTVSGGLAANDYVRVHNLCLSEGDTVEVYTTRSEVHVTATGLEPGE